MLLGRTNRGRRRDTARVVKEEGSFFVLFSTGISVRDAGSLNHRQKPSLFCSDPLLAEFFATTATVLTWRPMLSSQFLRDPVMGCLRGSAVAFGRWQVSPPLTCCVSLCRHSPPFEGLNLILGRASSESLSSCLVPSPSTLESSFTPHGSSPCLTT